MPKPTNIGQQATKRKEEYRNLKEKLFIPSEVFYRREVVLFHEILKLGAKGFHMTIAVHHHTGAYLPTKSRKLSFLGNKV